MKKAAVIIFLAMALLTTGCADDAQQASVTADETTAEQTVQVSPDVLKIRNISSLATLSVKYNNVARSTKEPGTGFLNIGEKERTFWVEYSGTAKIGIRDTSEIEMVTDGNILTITIPRAEVIETIADSESFSYTISADGFLNKNPITAEDQTQAVAEAEENITATLNSDNTLLSNAQERAKKLIQNYIDQINKYANTQYEIVWQYE